MNGKRSESLVIEQSIRQDSHLSPLLYILALEPLLCKLRDEEANLVLRKVPIVGCHRKKVSSYADDVTVFGSRLLDIEAVKEVIAS